MEIYLENPSIGQAIINTKKGVKLHFNNTNCQFTVLRHDSEEMQSAAIDFVAKTFVDKDQFIKIYIHSFPVLADLKNSTKVLFQYVLMAIHKGIKQDSVYLSYEDYEDCVSQYPLMSKISKATYFRCINELLDKQILFKSNKSNIYFINIAYIFNGDRLTFIRQYQLKKGVQGEVEAKEDEIDDLAKEVNGD
ncbi:hypothetical protein [Burkholderia vietnamiensis]|uniref:hypothetical protein n=1 Tax=Burkholderia vietnamiensis TaxID=60552 RepID=UPI00158CE326|nr:hypothetical protein [Burkholderia vietnamiensis]